MVVEDPDRSLAVGEPGRRQQQGGGGGSPRDGLGRTGVKDVVLRVLRGQRELSEAVRLTTESEIYERTLHYCKPLDR